MRYLVKNIPDTGSSSAVVRWGESLLMQRSWEDTRSIITKAAYVVLHQLDLVLTVLAVSLGLSELNPVMCGLLGMPVLLLVTKQLVPLLIAWLVPYKVLVPANVLLLLLLGWNVKELLVFLY